jgi:hypothetical protein
MIPFANIENSTGVFITGDKPHWVMSSDSHPVRAFALKQAAVAFGRTTHLGGTGEYFIRIEDVSADVDVDPEDPDDADRHRRALSSATSLRL